MGDYVDINGHPTWIEETGAGTTVLVLHGGFSNSDGLVDVFAALATDHRLIAFDRRGHGRTADTDAPFHYSDMMTETVGVLEHAGGDAAHVVGYSDGGIIALLLALSRPDLVRSLVLIGTNYHYDGVVPGSFDDFGPDSDTSRSCNPAMPNIRPTAATTLPSSWPREWRCSRPSRRSPPTTSHSYRCLRS